MSGRISDRHCGVWWVHGNIDLDLEEYPVPSVVTVMLVCVVDTDGRRRQVM